MALSFGWGYFVMGFSAFLAKLLVEVGAVTRDQSVTNLKKWLAHLWCAGSAVSGMSCSVHQKYSFSSSYLCATFTPKHLGALLSNNNYWYQWEKSRLIHSRSRGLQEEHKKGVFNPLVQCMELPQVRLNAGLVPEELHSKDKWFGSWVLDSVRSVSVRAILSGWASVVCFILVFIFWLLFYPEVFATK